MNNDVTSQPPKLNYASLTQPISSAEITAYKSGMPNSPDKLLDSKAAMVGIGLVGVLIMLPLLIGFLATDIASAGRLLLLGFLLIVSATLIVQAWIKSRIKRLALLDRFAKENNLTLIVFVADPAYNGMIFDEGHSRQIDEALRFPGGAEIGNYRYVTGSGKNRQVHQYGYAKVKLSRRLPHMVLDSRKNNFLGMTNLPDVFKSSQSLKLEGDFNQYFDLYAPEEYARDALYVFTPDVMAAAIDSGQNYDMEIVDDELYIYQTTHHDLTKSGSIEKIVTVIEKVSGEVRDQSAYYSDERVGDKQQNVIATQGRRLKQGANWTVIIIVAAFILLQILQHVRLELGLGVFFYLAIPALIWAGVLFVLFRKFRK